MTTSCFLDFYGPDRESLGSFYDVNASTHEVQTVFQSETIEEMRNGVFRRRVDLKFITTPDQEVGQGRAELVATGGDGVNARHTLVWRVKSLFEVTPPRIFVSRTAPFTPQESVVVVRHSEKLPFTLKPTGTLPDGISFADNDQCPDSEQSLRFMIDAAAMQATRFARIHLESSITGEPALEIPVIIVTGVSHEDDSSPSRAQISGR